MVPTMDPDIHVAANCQKKIECLADKQKATDQDTANYRSRY